MKREIPIIFICILVALVFVIGCLENTRHQLLSAQNFLEDRLVSMNYSAGIFHSKVDYKSFNVGDTIRIRDVIVDISVRKNITSITFDVNYTYPFTNVTLTTLIFEFDEDLTNTYMTGDTVEITLTVDHTTYMNETKIMSMDMEVFKEGWNQTYFEDIMNGLINTNFFYQRFPKSVILKVK